MTIHVLARLNSSSNVSKKKVGCTYNVHGFDLKHQIYCEFQTNHWNDTRFNISSNLYKETIGPIYLQHKMKC